jgi:nucleoside-diphosphate-sugar epimerase
MSRVLVTGANGFVGRALVERLRRGGWTVRAALRRATETCAAETVLIGDLASPVDWRSALEGCGAVVHLAARVHVLHERETDAARAFHAVNVEATRALAEQATAQGVRRFVFLSSVKAAAEAGDIPLDDEVTARPESAYGRSKREAEIALSRIEGLDVTILRPPLVFGPLVGAQFRRLLKLAASGVPLPFGSIRNARSFVAVDALADAIAAALPREGQGAPPFFVTGGPPLSTPALIATLRRAMAQSSRLVPFPAALLGAAASLLGRTEEMRRLTDSLVLDDSRFRRAFGWSPPREQNEALAETARWFLAGAPSSWQSGD